MPRLSVRSKKRNTHRKNYYKTLKRKNRNRNKSKKKGNRKITQRGGAITRTMYLPPLQVASSDASSNQSDLDIDHPDLCGKQGMFKCDDCTGDIANAVRAECPNMCKTCRKNQQRIENDNLTSRQLNWDMYNGRSQLPIPTETVYEEEITSPNVKYVDIILTHAKIRGIEFTFEEIFNDFVNKCKKLKSSVQTTIAPRESIQERCYNYFMTSLIITKLITDYIKIPTKLLFYIINGTTEIKFSPDGYNFKLDAFKDCMDPLFEHLLSKQSDITKLDEIKELCDNFNIDKTRHIPSIVLSLKEKLNTILQTPTGQEFFKTLSFEPIFHIASPPNTGYGPAPNTGYGPAITPEYMYYETLKYIITQIGQIGNKIQAMHRGESTGRPNENAAIIVHRQEKGLLKPVRAAAAAHNKQNSKKKSKQNWGKKLTKQLKKMIPWRRTNKTTTVPPAFSLAEGAYAAAPVNEYNSPAYAAAPVNEYNSPAAKSPPAYDQVQRFAGAKKWSDGFKHVVDSPYERFEAPAKDSLVNPQGTASGNVVSPVIYAFPA